MFLLSLFNKIIIAIILAVLLIHFMPVGVMGGDSGVNPIAAHGFHWMIAEETHDLSKLLPAQRYILTDDEVVTYSNTHCEKLPNGNAGWRIYDKDEVFTNEDQIWVNTMKLLQPTDTLPHLFVSDGRRGVSMPLPKDKTDMLTVLKKYGGK